jgi:hypothetical protein
MNRDRRAALLNDEALGGMLRGLRPRVPPPGLTTALRVLASRERQRTYTTWRDRLHLFSTNLMRPLALPVAGGVMSAVVLFSMFLAPTYPILEAGSYDVPITVTTQATVRGSGPINATGGEVTVEVFVNGQGRMVDYVIVSGIGALDNGASRRNIETVLMLTEFNPATNAFGQPISGKMRLTLRSSHIDVKG